MPKEIFRTISAEAYLGKQLSKSTNLKDLKSTKWHRKPSKQSTKTISEYYFSLLLVYPIKCWARKIGCIIFTRCTIARFKKLSSAKLRYEPKKQNSLTTKCKMQIANNIRNEIIEKK
jgi:hypothetical protein